MNWMNLYLEIGGRMQSHNRPFSLKQVWLLLAVVLAITTNHAFAASSGTCNGRVEYCSRKYNEITIPGTHNSFAIGENLASNHKSGTSISKMLDGGIRLLNFDLHRKEDGSVNFCHTRCDNSLFLDAGSAVSNLQQVGKWLSSNPREILTVLYENSDGISASEIADIHAQAGLAQFARTKPAEGEWETLGTMVEDGKRLLVFVDRGADGSVPWLMDSTAAWTSTEYRVFGINAFNCAPITGDSPDKGLLLNHFVSVQLTSANAELYIPDSSLAPETNSYSVIKSHAGKCSRRVNAILVDWWDTSKEWLQFVDDYNAENLGIPKKSGGQTASFKMEWSLLIFTIVAMLFI